MNFLFAGSHAGAERAAIAYSIIGSRELLDIDPIAYLADVLPRLAREDVVLARDVPALLPAAWKKARAGAESARPPPDERRPLNLADVPRLARDGVVLGRDVPAIQSAAWKKAREAAATATTLPP